MPRGEARPSLTGLYLISHRALFDRLAQAFLNNNLQPQNKGSRRSQSYHEISIVSIDYDEPSNVSCFTW